MPGSHHTMSSRSTPLRDATNTQSYSSSTSRSFSHKPAGDAFRPQLLGLPKDPFAAKPWVVNLDVLPSSSSRIRQTILVIGTPPQSDVRALVHSEALRNSFLLIATHDVKPFASSLLLSPIESEASSSASCGPTTRILRLGSPLFPQNRSTTPSASRTTSSLQSASASTTSLPAPSSGGGSDALRVMSLLNRASQVASSLEACTCDNGPGSTSSMSRIQQLGENPLTGEFNVFEVLGTTSPLASISQSRPPSIASPEVKRSRRQTLQSIFGFGSSSLPPSASAAAASPGSTSTSSSAQTTPSSPASANVYVGSPACGNADCAGGVGAAGKATRGGQGGGRSFDALINYLPSPSSIPEKIILKQAILTTTLSAPYLSSSALQQSPSPSKPEPKAITDKAKKKEARASRLGIPLSRKPTSASSNGDLRPSSRLSKRQSRIYASSTIGSFPEEDPTMHDLLEAVEKYTGPGHLLHVVPDSTSLFNSSTQRSASTQRVAHRPRDSSIPSLAKPKLVAGIEQFILAFAYPVAEALKPSASAAPSISSARGRDFTPLPSPSSSYSAASAMPAFLGTGSASTSGPLLSGELGGLTAPRTQSLSAILNGKPAPYIVKAGVLGEVFSFSFTKDDSPRTISIADLLLFGGLDGSVEEHGGGKAWLGGVGVREIVEELSGSGKLQGSLEVRSTKIFEQVWVGGVDTDPRPSRVDSSQSKRDSPKARRRSLSRTPSSSSLGAASTSSTHSQDKPERVNRCLSKVSRKPAPALTPSDSMTAAWDALQSQSRSKPTLQAVENETSAAQELEAARQEFTERTTAATSRTRRKSNSAWNPNTGLLTPPGSSSEKDVDLETDSSRQDICSTSSPDLTQSLSPPSTMGERTDSSHSEESSASVPTPPSSRENEESFDFASCYQYDRSQCPEREQPPQDVGVTVKGVGALPIKDNDVVGDLGSVRSKAQSTRKYHYITAIHDVDEGRGAGDAESTIAHSTTASSIKKRGRLSKFLGRVLSIRGTPNNSSAPRRRRLSGSH